MYYYGLPIVKVTQIIRTKFSFLWIFMDFPLKLKLMFKFSESKLNKSERMDSATLPYAECLVIISLTRCHIDCIFLHLFVIGAHYFQTAI